MRKKMLIICLVLVVAVSALGATPTLPANVVATLKATLGDYLWHGFVVSGQSGFQSSAEVTNAFGSTAPSFTYGYETNATGPYYLRMAVSDFTNGSGGSVKIKSIGVSGGGATLTWNAATASYTVFTVPANNTYTSTTALFTVRPALLSSDATANDHLGNVIGGGNAAQAPAGNYVATITFSVSAS